ncbi:hypothetical protein ZWY2020_054957 [Hordeum vulgare]|nr:hypothetical protein ZWY2020_054957 [Hordeum vulgare]
MPAGRKRPAPAPFAGFSTFARSSSSPRLRLLQAASHLRPAAKPHQATGVKRAKQADPSSDDEEERPSDAEADSDGDGDGDSDSSLECSSSDDDDDASQEMETVQADFAFFDPKPTDFHGVRLLLKTYLDSKPWDLTGFVDLVLEQTTVGTVVKMAEDEDGEANGGDKSDEAATMMRTCSASLPSNRCWKKASTVGLLVCRRFVNFPYEMVPKMYDSLFDEVSWATEDEPTQELQDSFRFKQYLFLVRILERKTPPKQKSKNNKDEDEPVIYPKLEDEILRELSTWSFTFPIRAEQSAQQELKNYKEMGLVMCVKADVIPKFRKKLEALVSE